MLNAVFKLDNVISGGRKKFYLPPTLYLAPITDLDFVANESSLSEQIITTI